MSRRSYSYFAGIATAVLLLAASFCAVAEQIIVVTQAVENPFPQRAVPYRVGPRPVVNVAVPQPAQPATSQELPDNILAWNTTLNEDYVAAGAAMGNFTFIFTNVSSAPVTIISSAASCGCTAANLPDLPKTVQPQEHVEFQVQMNVAGQRNSVEKTVTINTDKGNKVLRVRTVILSENVSAMNEEERRQNLAMATADRQAVFRADCARCHAEPARNKMGKELYAVTCAICHDSVRRASMVPDLHNLALETSAAFWSTWITYGKPTSLMPAFSKTQDGILSPEQITSLVDYLVEAIPPKPGVSSTKTSDAASDGNTSPK